MSGQSKNPSPEDTLLFAKVEQSLEKEEARRDSFMGYLTEARPPNNCGNLETAKRFKGSALGKIMESTASQVAALGLGCELLVLMGPSSNALQEPVNKD